MYDIPRISRDILCFCFQGVLNIQKSKKSKTKKLKSSSNRLTGPPPGLTVVEVIEKLVITEVDTSVAGRKKIIQIS